MNSHIQITQRILKEFSHNERVIYEGHKNKEKYVYFADFKTHTIGNEKVRLFGSEIDFFSLDIETSLSTNFEGPFGELMSKIIDCKNINTLSLNGKDVETALKFAKVCCYRNKNNINNALEFFKRHGKKLAPDDVIRATRDNAKFDYENVCILKNETQEDFVVPFNCLCFIKYLGIQSCILPISPKFAFLFSKEEILYKVGDIHFVKDEKIVININLACIDVESKNQNLIVCKNKETIIKLCNLKNIEIKEKESDA